MFSKKVTIMAENVPSLSSMLSMLDEDQNVQYSTMAVKLLGLEMRRKYPNSKFEIIFQQSPRSMHRTAESWKLKSYKPFVECTFLTKGDFNKFKLVEGFTEEV